MFVDDIFILGTGNEEDWRYMKSMVDLLCKAFGLDINYQNSIFIYTNVEEAVLQATNSSWNVAFSPLEARFKFLGYFLKATSYKITDWYWLLKKFEKRINFWANQWLSMGNRLVLVKAILQNIQVY